MLNTSLLLDKLVLVAAVVVKVYKVKHIFGENISIEYTIGAHLCAQSSGASLFTVLKMAIIFPKEFLI